MFKKHRVDADVSSLPRVVLLKSLRLVHGLVSRSQTRLGCQVDVPSQKVILELRGLIRIGDKPMQSNRILKECMRCTPKVWSFLLRLIKSNLSHAGCEGIAA